MKRKMLAASLAVAAMVQISEAGVPLSTLIGGGSLSVDGLTFGNFDFASSGIPTNSLSFDPAQILVSANDINGVAILTWQGNISVTAVNGVATGDLLLSYTVSATPGTIAFIDQSYTGSAQQGALAVDETVSDGTTIVADSHLTATDIADPPGEPIQGDNLNIPSDDPASIFYVTKDIALTAVGTIGDAGVPNNLGFVTISQVEQSFHPVPEPTTIGLIVLGLGTLVGYKRWTK